MVTRTTMTYQEGRVIDVVERHQTSHSNSGLKRASKTKKTQISQKRVNTNAKKKLCRQKLLANFNEGDCFFTLTYRREENPTSLHMAKQDFSKFMRRVRTAYQKNGKKPLWIRNIELGVNGEWHIHLVLNDTGDTYNIVTGKWTHGYVHKKDIRLDDMFDDEDFTKLANYITKGEGPNAQMNNDDSQGRPVISSYSCSRGLYVPNAEAVVLNRYPKESETKDGYQEIRKFEGCNAFSGQPYRQYTLVKIDNHKRG